MTNDEVITAAKEQLGTDLACRACAFDCETKTVVEYRGIIGRRHFPEKSSFFQMVTFGSGVALSTSPALLSFSRRFASSGPGIRLFDFPRLAELNGELNAYGYAIGELYE